MEKKIIPFMISIVVPVYNVEKYIIKCLESIVNQSYKDFELLLVNDGSKDNSVNLINDYLKGLDINWKIVNKENGGLASARNAGIKKAKGEYISFVDSDDCVSYNFLETFVDSIEEDNYDFVFCNFEFVKEQIPPIDNNDRKHIFEKEELLKTFLKRSIGFVVPSMFFKKSFIIDNDLYFNEELKFSEDQPFIWKTILASNKSLYLYKKMYGYYVRENSIMTATSYEKIINSHKEFIAYTNNLFSKFPQYNGILNRALPRWELGSLYTSAKLVSYGNYKNIYNEMNGKTILSRIKGIGEKNAYLLAFVCSLSCKLMYELCRKMNLNG